MKNNPELKYILSFKGILLTILSVIGAVAAYFLMSGTIAVYAGDGGYGWSVVKQFVPEYVSGSGQNSERGYRELSDEYRLLTANSTEWTDMENPLGEDGTGEKGGLYFISKEDLEISIYDCDCVELCGGGYELKDFDHIWINSEDSGFYVVINMSGKYIDLSGFYILCRDSSQRYASRVIINAYEAKTVVLNDTIFTGTLLAPDAVVLADNAFIYGEILSAGMIGTPKAQKLIRFGGYDSIMDTLAYAVIRNDSIRKAAIRDLVANDRYGRYKNYTEDSNILKGDLEAVRSLDLSGVVFDEDIEHDLVKFRLLEVLKLNNTNVKTLSLNGLDYLRELEMSDTPVESLNISEASSLMRLVLDNTALTSLDTGKNTELRILSVNGSKTGWPVSAPLPHLTYLDCTGSGAVSEKITGEMLPALTTLKIADNPGIKAVDGTTFPELTALDAKDCSLTEFYPGQDTKLTYIRLSGNPIRELDFSMINHIFSVECYSNQLVFITVTRWASVVGVYCPVSIWNGGRDQTDTEPAETLQPETGPVTAPETVIPIPGE